MDFRHCDLDVGKHSPTVDTLQMSCTSHQLVHTVCKAHEGDQEDREVTDSFGTEVDSAELASLELQGAKFTQVDSAAAEGGPAFGDTEDRGCDQRLRSEAAIRGLFGAEAVHGGGAHFQLPKSAQRLASVPTPAGKVCSCTLRSNLYAC